MEKKQRTAFQEFIPLDKGEGVVCATDDCEDKACEGGELQEHKRDIMDPAKLVGECEFGHSAIFTH